MVIKKFCLNTNRFGITTGGWGNGYIGLPENHPLYGVHYSDYDKFEYYYNDVWPHGGWTYSDCINPETQEDDGFWWLGFDTGHSGDDKYNCNEQYVRDLVDKLAEAYVTIDIKLEELEL